MDIPWDNLRIFLAIAEAGSLSKAAKRLRVTQPTVTRHLAELEALVGEAMFLRSAGGVRLTAFGDSLIEPARRMAEWAAEADRVAERVETTPRGPVRITAPPGLAFEFVAPFAARLKQLLPDIRLEVLASTQDLDISRREADLALRFAAPAQRDVVTLATLHVEVAAFASVAYAESLPRRCRPQDVAWICWAPPFEHMSPNPELARLIPEFAPAFASDDFLVQLRAAEAGLGAMFLGRVSPRFSSFRLVEVPLGLALPPRPLYLACARSALDIPRVRAVANLLETELARAATNMAP